VGVATAAKRGRGGRWAEKDYSTSACFLHGGTTLEGDEGEWLEAPDAP
jgi:hypothetical protein